MADFTATSITYTAQAAEGSFTVSFVLDTSMPTEPELDAAVTALFDQLEADRPGFVSYVRKELGGRASIAGNFWGS